MRFVKKGHFAKIIPTNTHLFVNDRRNENVPLFNGTTIKTNINSHNTIKGQWPKNHEWINVSDE